MVICFEDRLELHKIQREDLASGIESDEWVLNIENFILDLRFTF